MVYLILATDASPSVGLTPPPGLVDTSTDIDLAQSYCDWENARSDDSWYYAVPADFLEGQG